MTRPSIPKQSCIAETIVDTEDNDDDEEAIRESDPVVDLVGGQPGAQGLAELGEDAGAVPTIESLNAIAEAEQLADNATGNGNMDLLECEHLSSLERSVPIRYSVILGDGFHLLDRMWVPMHHEFKKSFYYAYSNALYQWDPEDLERVRDILMKEGWTKDEFESTL
jgi:hypothetical protein